MKRLLPATAATAAALLLAGCGSSGDAQPSAAEEDRDVTVGVSQFADNPSLEAARRGFVEGLREGGYTEGENLTLDVRKASGGQGAATSIAADLAASDDDLFLGIATPAAQALAQAVPDRPVLFTAVTDGEGAGLVNSHETPGGNVTGTTDMNPVAEQIKLVTRLAPRAKSVGILCSPDETNSLRQVELAREAAREEGLKVVVKTVSTPAEVAQAANALTTDAIYVPTDNHVVAGLDAVVAAAESKQIPLVAGDVESVERGALATRGIDYRQLGEQTGEMAARILDGEAQPSTTAVEEQEETELVVNAAAARAMGVTLPRSLRRAADRVVD